MTRWRAWFSRSLVLGALVCSLVPGIAAADEEPGGQVEPIVLAAPYTPYWRVVPPTTDPERATLGARWASVRGISQGVDGALLVLDLGTGTVNVELPPGETMAADVPVGALVEATGPTYRDGTVKALQATIWIVPS